MGHYAKQAGVLKRLSVFRNKTSVYSNNHRSVELCLFCRYLFSGIVVVDSEFRMRLMSCLLSRNFSQFSPIHDYYDNSSATTPR